MTDEHCGATYLADVLGLTRRRVQQLVKTGVIARVSRGKYDLRQSVQAYIAFLQRSGSSMNYHDAKAKRETAEASMAEMRLRQMRGDLLPREVVEDEVARCISNCKSRFLGLPTKAAPVVIGMDEAAAKTILKEMIYEALDELSALPEAKNEATK